MELKGKTAVITGASGQLGGAIAISLAQAGCNCICHYNSNKESAQKVVRQIEENGSKALAVYADLTVPEQIEKLFTEASKIGIPQILINSAAVFSRQSLADITFAEAQKIFNVNFTYSPLANYNNNEFFNHDLLLIFFNFRYNISYNTFYKYFLIFI